MCDDIMYIVLPDSCGEQRQVGPNWNIKIQRWNLDLIYKSNIMNMF